MTNFLGDSIDLLEKTIFLRVVLFSVITNFKKEGIFLN